MYKTATIFVWYLLVKLNNLKDNLVRQNLIICMQQYLECAWLQQKAVRAKRIIESQPLGHKNTGQRHCASNNSITSWERKRVAYNKKGLDDQSMMPHTMHSTNCSKKDVIFSLTFLDISQTVHKSGRHPCSRGWVVVVASFKGKATPSALFYIVPAVVDPKRTCNKQTHRSTDSWWMITLHVESKAEQGRLSLLCYSYLYSLHQGPYSKQ